MRDAARAHPPSAGGLLEPQVRPCRFPRHDPAPRGHQAATSWPAVPGTQPSEEPQADPHTQADPAGRARRACGAGQADLVQHIGIDLAWGVKQPTGLAVLDDAGPAGARQRGAHRRADRDRARPVHRRPVHRGDRRPAGGHQRHREPGRRAGAQRATSRSSRPGRTRRTPANPSSPTVTPAAGGSAGARPGPRPPLGPQPPGDRGLPARGDGGAVPAGPHAEVQEQAGPGARADAHGAASAHRPAGRVAELDPRSVHRSPRCASRCRPPPASASCGWRRTRSTPWCAPTWDGSPSGARTR